VKEAALPPKSVDRSAQASLRTAASLLKMKGDNMSFDFFALPTLLYDDVIDGRLEVHGIRAVTDPNDDRSACLFEGNQVLWVYAGSNGDANFVSCACYQPIKIIEIMRDVFGVDFVEDDPYNPEIYSDLPTKDADASYIPLRPDRDRSARATAKSSDHDDDVPF
jgi:hypothetical protein